MEKSMENEENNNFARISGKLKMMSKTTDLQNPSNVGDIVYMLVHVQISSSRLRK